MAKSMTFLKVFVASPSDVSEERELLEKEIADLNNTWAESLGIQLRLVRWETHAYPGIGEDPQAVINQQIGEDYDIFVGILWKRFGTPTNRAASGTAEEFYQAYRRYGENPDAIRIMFYFKDALVAPSELDPEQLAAIRQFKEELGEQGTLYWKFTDPQDFVRYVRMHLSRQVQDWKIGWGKGSVLLQPASLKTDPVSANGTSEVATIQDEDEEQGFLDLIEIGEERFCAALDDMQRITGALEELGSRVGLRTDELQQVKHSEAKSQVKQYKRVSNGIARDMEQFVKRLNGEIPAFSDNYTAAIDAWGRAAVLWTDFGHTDKQVILDALDGARELSSNLHSAQASIVEFRHTIGRQPRLTITFNQAKRHTLAALDALNDKMSNVLNLTVEVEKIFESIINDQDDSDSASSS